MSLLDQWQNVKRKIEAALAEGRLDPDAAEKALAHLNFRMMQRPRILKRRQDRKAWRKAQVAKLMGNLGAVSSAVRQYPVGERPL